MFQWSSNRQRTDASTYPGQRNNGVVTAQNIQGSIRPPSEYTRAQHLESYLNDATLQRSTRRIPPGDSTYDTVFQTVKGDTLILRVQLGPGSSSRPTFSLAGVQAQHPWFDERMRVVGYAPIQSDAQWKDSRLLLGQAVHQVVQELQVRPPQVQQIVDSKLASIQSKHKPTTSSVSSSRSSMRSSASTTQDGEPPAYTTFLKSVPSVDMPAVPTSFPELEDLDRDQLDELLNDELEFQTFCHKLPYMQTLRAMGVSVLDDNAKTAEDQLKQEKELKDLHKVCETLQEQLTATVSEFQKLEQQQDKLCKPPDRRKMIKELTKAKKEAFDRSEELAEEWLELGDAAQGMDDFAKNFIRERKLHHVRAAKLELLEFMPSQSKR